MLFLEPPYATMFLCSILLCITYYNVRQANFLFELSGLKRRGAPGGWAWSRSREGILKLCDVVVQ
jgi:hypothetical protein